MLVELVLKSCCTVVEAGWKSLPPGEREEKLKLLQSDKYLVTINNRSVSLYCEYINTVVSHPHTQIIEV